MLHHHGLPQPLLSSKQSFEDSFINFQIWDKRKEIRGLDLVGKYETKKTKRKMMISPSHTEKNPQAYIFDNNDDQKLFFLLFLKGKSILWHNWYILFLLILSSSINECWHEQLSHRARQLRSVHKQSFFLFKMWKKWVFTRQDIFKQGLLFWLITQSVNFLRIQSIFESIKCVKSPQWHLHIACFSWSTARNPKIINFELEKLRYKRTAFLKWF